MGYSKSIGMIATVILPGKLLKSGSGKTWCKLPIRAVKGGELYNAIGFDTIAVMLCHLNEGNKISLKGRNEPGTNDIIVDTFVDESKMIVTPRTREEVKKDLDESEAYHLSKGYVPIMDKNVRTWHPKESCRQLNDGTYQLKIDYLMDIMTPEAVTKALRAYLSTTDLLNLGKVKEMKISKFIDELIEKNSF